MILTCPACATRYFVEDAKVGPKGKTVRCAACANTWKADIETSFSNRPAEAPAIVAGEPESDLDIGPIEPARALELPKAIRARANQRKAVRGAVAHGVVWGALAASVSAIVVMGILFRGDVVRYAPRSAGLYAAVGLPVNPTGLAFENVTAQPSLQDGHSALVVSGVIRNIDDRAITAPPLRISILGQDDKALAGKLANAGDGHIAPGEARHFMVSLVDPPRAATNVDVSFAVGAKVAPTPAKRYGASAEKHAKAPAPALRPAIGASPEEPGHVIQAVDAVPLDSHSPYALPDRG